MIYWTSHLVWKYSLKNKTQWKRSKFWLYYFYYKSETRPIGLINQGCLMNSVQNVTDIFLNLDNLDACLITSEVVFHIIIGLNTIAVWHFYFEHRGDTNLLFTQILVSWLCGINWLSILWVYLTCFRSRIFLNIWYKTK